MRLLDGKKIAKEIYKELKGEFAEFLKKNIKPKMAVVLVGDDPASLAYIAAKRAKAEDLSVDFSVVTFPGEILQEELCHKVVDINRTQGICGIVIQLPLPKQIEKQQVLDCVLPSLDIDGLGSANQTKLFSGTNAYVPPAPAAILRILDYYKINLDQKHVLIVGAGDLIGKPLSRLLMQREIPVSIITENTVNAKKIMRSADIVISAVGQKGIVRGPDIKKGAIVIDAGTSLAIKGGKVKLSGDVDFESVKNKASYITPVPGGVGPVTVAMLYKNLLRACKKNG